MIGFGKWGQKTLFLLARKLVSSHPELLDKQEYVYIDEHSAHWFSWLSPSPLRTFNEPTWSTFLSEEASTTSSETFLKNNTNILNQAIREATSKVKANDLVDLNYLPETGNRPILDVHVFGRLEEKIFLRNLFLFIRHLQNKHPAAIKFRIYLYIAMDTTNWSSLPKAEQKSLKSFNEQLDQFLIQEKSRGDIIKDGVHNCYLIDTINENSRTIAPYRLSPSSVGERITSLSEIIAGFIALQVYSEIHLNDGDAFTGISYNLDKDQGYCSSIGIGGIYLPLPEIRQKLSLIWGKQLLNQFLPEQSADSKLANQSIKEFFTNHRLENDTIRRNLITTPQSKTTIHIHFDPSILNNVPYDELVDRILSWKAIEEQNKLQPLFEQIEENANKILNQTQEWIKVKVDEFVLSPERKCGTALIMCQELKTEIQKIKNRTSSPARENTHWLTEIFSVPPKRGQKQYPDIRKLQHKLQRALAERVNRLAVWFRFALLAGAEGGLIIISLPYLGNVIQKYFGENPTHIINVLGIPTILLLVFILNTLAAFRKIIRSEQKISNAQRELINAIEQQMSFQINAEVEKKIENIYNRLEVVLNEEISYINQWIAANHEMIDTLEKIEKQPWFHPHNSYERSLIEPEALSSLIPKLNNSDICLTFRKLVTMNSMQGWRQPNQSIILNELMIFLSINVRETLSQQTIEGYIDRHLRDSLDDIIQQIRSQVKIQLDLTEHPVAPRFNFLFLEDKDSHRLPQHFAPANTLEVITTLDPSRITYLQTVQGLPLNKLSIWENLP